MTIRGRIALVSATAVGIAVVLISVGTFAGAKRQVMGQIDESLTDRAAVVDEVPPSVLLAILGVERADLRRERFVPPNRDDFDSSYYKVIFPDGRSLDVGDTDLVLPEPRPEDLKPPSPSLRSEWIDGVHVRIATLVRSDARAIVQIGRPLTEADAALAQLALLLVLGGLVGVAVAGGLGLLVARSAVKPISELTGSIGSIAQTRSFTERVDVIGSGEVAELASEFNLLLDELESAKEEQVRLVRDAGHELRTPLTALRTNLEVLQRHEVEPELRTTMIAAAHAEVEELASLVGEIVDLATDRYEEESVESVHLGELVSSVAARIEGRRGRSMIVETDDTVVPGKRNALERAVTNIIANADKFSPLDVPVEVAVMNGVVTVTDAGSGFDKHDLPHVFERFYRSDAARGEPGSGLGLSIVQQIVDDHGGEVFARNRPEGGAEVGFSLSPDS